jgi:hypothetical protein
MLATGLIAISLFFGNISDTTSLVVLKFSEPMMYERIVCDSTVNDTCVHWTTEPLLTNEKNYMLKETDWAGAKVPIYHVVMVNQYDDWGNIIECNDTTVVILVCKRLKQNHYYQVWAINQRDKAGNLINDNSVGFFFDAFQPSKVPKPTPGIIKEE